MMTTMAVSRMPSWSHTVAHSVARSRETGRQTTRGAMSQHVTGMCSISSPAQART